jgi:hypothetical protein
MDQCPGCVSGSNGLNRSAGALLQEIHRTAVARASRHRLCAFDSRLDYRRYAGEFSCQRRRVRVDRDRGRCRRVVVDRTLATLKPLFYIVLVCIAIMK